MTAQFHDIIPPNKRSIRNVPLNISVEDEPKHVKKSVTERHTHELMKIIEKERVSGKTKSIWIGSIVAILVISFIIISSFSNANISIITAIKPLTVDIGLALSHNSSSTSAVDFDIISLSVSDNIPESSMHEATGTAALGSKSIGTVTISNNFSSTPQILIKNTRLEATNGMIFFLNDKVTVPGMTTSKNIKTPGAVSVKVTAEKEGSDYNIGTSDFTLPALKSTPRYKLITGKTKTTFSGGTDAHSKTVVDDTALENIHESLLANAEKQIVTQKSDDYIFLDGGLQYSLVLEGTSTATLNVSALILKKSDLLSQIQINNNLDIHISQTDMKGSILGTSSLSIKLPDDLKLKNATTTDALKIRLVGTTTISSNFQEGSLKSELAGQNYDLALKLLKNKIGSEAVNIEIWPWWVTTIPVKQDKINIKIENN